MSTVQDKERAIRFFADHAGYSYDPATETEYDGRMRCAVDLARAEAEAVDRGYAFVWDWDEEGCSGCDCGDDSCDCFTGNEHETLWARCETDTGYVLASIGSICGADRDYVRVVNAELALEAIGEMDRAYVDAWKRAAGVPDAPATLAELLPGLVG